MRKTDSLSLSAVVDLHMEGLRRLRAMWLDTKVLFYEDEVPEKREDLIFLAGPTSRDGIPDYMWRKDAVHFLRLYGYEGRILVPELRGYSYLAERSKDDFTDTDTIIRWEHVALKNASHRVFWIPRNREQLLGLTTNREISQWMGRAESNESISESLFIGWPHDAVNMASMDFELQESRVGRKKGGHYTSLEALCKELASFFDDFDIPF